MKNEDRDGGQVLPDLFDLYTTTVEQALRKLLTEGRDSHVRHVMRILNSSNLVVHGKGADASSEGEWQLIDSLSRLRSAVGGRFDNIKKKWISAGLPLKEHRGDKGKNVLLKEQGWIELCDWINRQGFEVRRCAEDGAAFFEIKPAERP
jgi:hypothetical protein